MSQNWWSPPNIRVFFESLSFLVKPIEAEAYYYYGQKPCRKEKELLPRN